MTPRRASHLLVALTCAIAFGACNQPDAPDCIQRAGANARDSVVFEGVDATSLLLYDRIDVTWEPGEPGRTVVVWEGPENLLADAETDWDGATLTLGDGNTCRWVRDLGITLRATVRSPALAAVEHRGAGRFIAALPDRPGTFRLDARNCSGSIDLDAAGDTVAVLLHSGAVTATLTGSPTVLEAFSAGLSGLDASRCYSTRAFIHQAALRPLRFRATEYAYLALTGPGDAVLHGTSPADLELERTGEGELRTEE